MVLNSTTIQGLIRGDIQPEQIQQVGIDLTLKAAQRVRGGMILKDRTVVKTYDDLVPEVADVKRANGDTDVTHIYKFKPGHYAVRFNEGIDVPKDAMALVLHRSSLLRSGGILISALWDPGFGTAEMGSFMSINEEVMIEQDARIAQVFFVKSEEVPEELLYNGQWQGK